MLSYLRKRLFSAICSVQITAKMAILN